MKRREEPLGEAQPRLRAPVVPGDVIAGKYRVDRILGEGGMGVVVAAIHEELGSAVAIKFVRAEYARHPEVVARFQREARIAARLKTDHVARVTDVGVLPVPDGQVPYMVLEYLEGTDLSAVIEKNGLIPIEEAVSHVVEACEAVDEAHGLGIVHRDLKPANLFLVKRARGKPIVKVLDFGISSMAAGDADARLTATGTVMGTPLYMAPEQMLDASKADQRTDIWALGAILYELLTGAPPYPGTTFGIIHARMLASEAKLPRALRPELPAELEAVVMRCLRKPADERFQSIADLEQALRPLLHAGLLVPRGFRMLRPSPQRSFRLQGRRSLLGTSHPRPWPRSRTPHQRRARVGPGAHGIPRRLSSARGRLYVASVSWLSLE